MGAERRYGRKNRVAGGADAELTSTSRASDRALPWLVAVTLFLIYLRTMTPAMQMGDGTELAAAAAALGVPHPTGYPLYMMLGWLWQALVPGDAVSNMTLLNGALMAAAAGVTSSILLDAMRTLWRAPADKAMMLCAAAGGLAAGLLRFHWNNAVVTEVYALEFLLMVVFVRCVQKADASGGPSTWNLLGATACLALGLAHHRLSICMGLPWLALWILAWHRRTPGVRLPWVAAAFILLAGAALYAYIPIRAAAQPAINWGNAVTWDRFYNHVRGTEYLDRGLLKPAMGQSYSGSTFSRFALLQTQHLLTDAVGQLAPVRERVEVIPGTQKVFILGGGLTVLAGFALLVAAAAGLWRLWRSGQRWTSGVITAVAVQNLGILFVYNIVDIRDYFLFPLWALWVGVALLLANFMARFSESKRPAIAYAWLLLPAAVLAGNWARCDASDDVTAEAISAAILPEDKSIMPPGSILITDDDAETFTTWYRQRVRSERTDVLHFGGNFVYMPWYLAFFTPEQISQYKIKLAPAVARSAEEYARQLRAAIIDANVAAHPIFTTINDGAVLHALSEDYTVTALDKLDYVNRGLFNEPGTVVLYRIEKKDRAK